MSNFKDLVLKTLKECVENNKVEKEQPDYLPYDRLTEDDKLLLHKGEQLGEELYELNFTVVLKIPIPQNEE